MCLDAFGSVYDDDDGIDGCEGSVGIFGEVLVAWCVEDIYFVVAVVELHDGGGYGDAALLFDVHPVGCGGLSYFVVFNGAGHLDLSSKEEELLGECGFAGVGVGYDGEGASSFYFVHRCGGFGLGFEPVDAVVECVFPMSDFDAECAFDFCFVEQRIEWSLGGCGIFGRVQGVDGAGVDAGDAMDGDGEVVPRSCAFIGEVIDAGR